MNKLEDRLKELMSECGLKTKQDLATLAGVSRGLVGQWFSGDTGLGKKPLLNIAKKTRFNPEWVADGTGSKYQTGSIESETPIDLGQGNTAPNHSTIAAIEDQEDLSAYEHIELYDVKLSAGNGTTTWIAREDEPLLFRKAWLKKRGFSSECCKGMYVRGDSMQPALEDWDTVLIDTSDTELVTGEIYAVAYKGKTFIKEVRVRPDSVELVSINTKYEPIIIPDNEADQLQVLGRKVWRGG